jgi:hypothetical protein
MVSVNKFQIVKFTKKYNFYLLDLQLPVQSVPITNNIVSSNPTHGEVYSIQHYVTKFVSDLRQVSDFLRFLWFPRSVFHQ